MKKIYKLTLILLVPTLCVGMQPGRSASIRERAAGHSHAERQWH
jgi:hypothetical protein